MIRNFIFCFALLLGAFSYAQNFTLNLVPTLETCFGNGAVAVTVENATAGATVDYVIYKLPNVTNPIAVGVGNAAEVGYPHNFSGLTSGEYQVVATQVVNGVPVGSVIELVTVAQGASHVTPTAMQVVPYILCGDDGTITVTITQGVAQYYKLLKEEPEGSGIFVEVAGPQGAFETTTVFTGLTSGHYRVLVQDATCDIPVVYTQFISSDPIPPVEFGGNELTPILTDCVASEVKVEQAIQVPLIAFPIDIKFTVYPPDGSTPVEIFIEDYPANGTDDPQNLVIEQMIPFYHGEYYFEVNVTNQCGDNYSFNSGNQPVFFELDVNAKLSPKICYGIDVEVSGAIGGYTVQFLDRDDYLNGIETVINVGHISLDPLHSAIVHSHSPEDDPWIQHPNQLPINPEGGVGSVTYGIYDLVLLDANGDPVLVDQDGNPDPNGETVPILVGDYVIKVFDSCNPPQVGYFDSLNIPEEISEPNVNLTAFPPFPHTDPFLDCIAVGEVSIDHVLYLDKGENQDAEFMDEFGNIILPGKVEIIDAPADFIYFLDNYGFDADDNIVYLGPGLGVHPGLNENNPLDITDFVGLHPKEDSNPPNPDTLRYPRPTPYGTPRPIFPGLVGAGEYTIRITDICGNTWDIPEELDEYFTEDTTFSVSVAQGCEDLGSIYVIPGFDETVGEIEWAIVTQAPDEFYDMFGENSFEYGNPDIRRNLIDEDGNNVIVYDVAQPGLYWFYVAGPTPNDPGAYHMSMGGLPIGDYEILVRSGCPTGPINFTIEGYEQELTDFDMEVFCGNFNVMFDYTSNSSTDFLPTYVLQRCTQDDVENCTDADWMTIMTGLIPGEWNTGVTGTGHYRIVKYYQTYDMNLGGAPFLSECEVIIHEFDYFAIPGIRSIDVVACPGGGSMTIIDAIGAEPLTYELVEATVDENGVVTVISVILDNGENNIFMDLEPGEYYFRITDACGAGRLGAATIGEPLEFEIIEDNLCDGTENPLCDGSFGCLSVDYLSILEYEWYRVDENGVETPVLDEFGNIETGNQLHFEPYSVELHSGTYRVYLSTSNNLAFCSVNYIDYTLLDVGQPNAGEDTTQAFCHTNQTIDLFSVFDSQSIAYDLEGTWTDLDGTGALNGSVFDTNGIALGTYTFEYFIGGCNGSDQSIVTIILSEEPTQPVVEAFDAICPGEDLELSIDGANAQYTYTWTLPNGNTYVGATVPLTDLTAQDAGVYSVVASLGDCQSDATSVTVVLKPVPEFTIAVQNEICTTLSVNASNFNVADATYVWTFEGNQVEIDSSLTTKQEGEYTVTVTLDGCTSTQSVMVGMPEIVVEQGCVDNQFMLFVSNTGDFSNVSYDWSGPGFNGSGDTINISGLDSGEYTVTITHNTATIDGQSCSVSKTVTIDGTQCMIPKGVSPNDDGRNDTFDLSNFNVREVKIFNRYGRTVYEKENGYTNEWYGQTTDGDDLLPTATYYYLVTFIDGSQKSGWVYLNRDE